MVAPKRRISAVITLFFVAPLVAEYLLGDLPLKLLPVVIVLAPMYGGAAVLIRDVARRAGRGWPTMLLLAVAYMLVEEGLVTQSLFNHDYLKMQMHLLDPAYLPALGIGAWWTLLMINLHVFWSMGVSIALVEALYPAEADAPWVGGIGDAVLGVLFVLGSVANFGIGSKQNHFVASHAQLVSVAALCVLVAVCAYLLPRGDREAVGGAVPSAWVSGGVALALGLGLISNAIEVGLGCCGYDAGHRRDLSGAGVDLVVASRVGASAYNEPGRRWSGCVRCACVSAEAGAGGAGVDSNRQCRFSGGGDCGDCAGSETGVAFDGGRVGG
jgi:hypothetical protein